MTTRKMNLETRVAIYPGHTMTPDLAPDWVGTVNEYWEANQDTLTFGDIREMMEDLDHNDGRGFHYIGGGAQGCFTIRYA